MSKSTLILVAGGAIILIGGILLFVLPSKTDAPTEKTPSAEDNGLDTQDIATPDTVMLYQCEEGKTVNAGFSQAQVQITLSDGRAYTLEQTISASGARYANEGEEVVFWNKGNSAIVEEDGVVTYINCVESGMPQAEGMMIDGTPEEDLDNDMIDGQVESGLQVQ